MVNIKMDNQSPPPIINLFMVINIIMAIIFKYCILAFIFIGGLMFVYHFSSSSSYSEQFTTDWDPIGDPNHVKYHQNEIFYLKDWIKLLDHEGKTEESQNLKNILKPMEEHMVWHAQKYPDKSPPNHQRKFLVF